MEEEAELATRSGQQSPDEHEEVRERVHGTDKGLAAVQGDDRRAEQHRDRRDLYQRQQHRRRRTLKGAQQEIVVVEGTGPAEQRKPDLGVGGRAPLHMLERSSLRARQLVRRIQREPRDRHKAGDRGVLCTSEEPIVMAVVHVLVLRCIPRRLLRECAVAGSTLAHTRQAQAHRRRGRHLRCSSRLLIAVVGSTDDSPRVGSMPPFRDDYIAENVRGGERKRASHQAGEPIRESESRHAVVGSRTYYTPRYDRNLPRPRGGGYRGAGWIWVFRVVGILGSDDTGYLGI